MTNLNVKSDRFNGPFFGVFQAEKRRFVAVDSFGSALRVKGKVLAAKTPENLGYKVQSLLNREIAQK